MNSVVNVRKAVNNESQEATLNKPVVNSAPEKPVLNQPTLSPRTSKKQKLNKVQGDIQVSGKSTLGRSDSAKGEGKSSGGGIFGGFGDHWEADPLTTFMFENAPVILKLCQRSQEAMMKAEVSQTKEQSNAAQLNAKDTIAKGQAQAKQQNLDAAGEFAQSAVAALQAGLQVKDRYAGDDTYAKDLDTHDHVLNSLNQGSLENEVAATGQVTEDGSVDEEPANILNEEEKNAIDKKVEEFKAAHSDIFTKELEKREESSQTKLKKSFLGLDRNDRSVDLENEVLANREASRQAFDKVLGDGATSPEDKEFSELINGKSTDKDGNIIETPKSKTAKKRFMKKLFNEIPKEFDENGKPIFGETPLNMKQRMDLLGDWGSQGSKMKQEMLRTYGSTQEGVTMKDSFENERRMASERASIENNMNRKIFDTRQLLLQNLTGGAIKALVGVLKKNYIVAASLDEASASLNASIGQMNAQAKSAEDSFVANSLKDMTGIYEWFQNMHGQLISAQTSAASV
ncbi:MAG: hypothetical protein S4CHLAM7_04940 [Chlamydiae bacterium]|nr:hypothetical protein [Chlamydiota bacterium]